VKNISEKEDESEGMNSDDTKMIDKKSKQIYYLSVALFIIGLIFLVSIIMFYVSLFLIPIGLYGIVKYKSYNGKNRRIIYYKRGLIVLILGLMILIIEISVDVLMYSGHFFFPRPGAPTVSLEGWLFIWGIVIAVIVMLGGLFMVLKKLWYLKISTPSKKKKMEESKKIVDYLKIDNSGITQLRLSSVLQMDLKIINKCLHYLEWLGVIEKKKVSAEETLFFYKKIDEKYTNDEVI